MANLKQEVVVKIQDILDRYERSSALLVSEAYPDGGLEPLFPRLGRAALNQLEEGPAMVSRYAIWANTVRDTIIECIRELGDNPDNREAIKKLVWAANSLSAFADIQKLMDPMD
jgi:hypothetical protein